MTHPTTAETTMRERLARAIAASFDDEWDDVHPEDRLSIYETVDAVLEALREPTEAMLTMGVFCQHLRSDVPDLASDEVNAHWMREAWKIMVAEASK